ncbi:holin-like protein [Bacillus tianshenii]|uniref:Holin-like protein n=1 Tax=Sutcliffiella tianshenii TaxID=1463404 RepID=A0ABS2P3D4_9BACI|nr:CidA/LrgA family holin-like protein [Bacillus tianshenii]MBM7621381.1 holin-like protein [Bacillus tianshenii]
MKGIRIVLQIACLYFFYWIGVLIQRTFEIPVPGSIIGMLLLFFLLLSGIVKDRLLDEGSGLLLRYMPLFFVPATVGVIRYPDVFAGKGSLILLALLLSTFLVMVISGLVGQKAVELADKRKKRGV